jgi:hypothetical protein
MSFQGEQWGYRVKDIISLSYKHPFQTTLQVTSLPQVDLSYLWWQTTYICISPISSAILKISRVWQNTLYNFAIFECQINIWEENTILSYYIELFKYEIRTLYIFTTVDTLVFFFQWVFEGFFSHIPATTSYNSLLACESRLDLVLGNIAKK